MFYESILVVALSKHVDYWNRLGWKDVFSALVYTERQRQYVTGFGTDFYAPQAVMNGQYQLMGSRTVELVAIVIKAAKMPQVSILITATGGTAQVWECQRAAGTPAAQVVLVTTESGLASQVGRSEKSGRPLRFASVVRQLSVLDKVGADGAFLDTLELKLNPAGNFLICEP